MSHGPEFYMRRIEKEDWQAFDRGTRRWLYAAAVALAVVCLAIVLS